MMSSAMREVYPDSPEKKVPATFFKVGFAMPPGCHEKGDRHLFRYARSCRRLGSTAATARWASKPSPRKAARREAIAAGFSRTS